jgi:pilus assembly protein FimV
MMRKLVIFLTAAIMICMPLAANALGFGSLKLNSSLNEPLNADIELLSANSADVSSLSINLASPDAFLRAGIDRPALLSELKFKILQYEDGSYYINVTTRSPVREPFLNFLLEMNWQNGRMLREYTMLLDPPTQVRKQPSVVETPATVAPAEVAAQEAEAPAETPFVEPEPTMPESAVVEMPPEGEAETLAVMPAVPVVSEEGEVTEPAPEVAMAETGAEEVPPSVTEEVPPEPMPAEVPVLSEEGEMMETTPVEAPPSETAELAAVPVLSEQGEVVEAAPEATAPVEDPQLDIFTDDSELLPRIPLAAYGQAPVEEETYQPSGQLDYGIVRKGDNLWTIAEKLRPDESISVYQVMMALLQSNPDAFVDGNVNRLKVGHVLRIEDASLLTAMSQKEAALEYQAQTQAWEEYRQQVAAAPATQPIVASEVETGEVAEAPPSGELTLASPEGTELQAGSGTTDEAVSNDIVTLQDELRQVRNDANLMRNRNAELNSKLQELEQELSRLQRSVTIKDDELAALQQQLAEIQQQPMETGEPPAEAAAAMPEAEAEAQPEAPAPMAETEPAPEETASMAEPEPATEEAPAPEAEAPSEAAPAATVAEAAKPEPVKPVKPIPPPAAVPTPPQAEEGIMDTVMGVLKNVGDTLSGMFGNMVGDSLLIFIALPVLLVLVILMLILVRRRRKSGQAYQESILTGGPASVTGAAEAAEESEEESSFLSDFAVSGAGAIQTQDSEVDPLTEADVFMAYGRYEAAEERLGEAIKNEPGRPELKLKLLELYHATKNKPAFENTAEDFYASLGDDATSNPMWQKVASMGAELVPGNPLFSGGKSGADLPDLAASQDPGVGFSDSQVMDIGLDTGVFDAADIGAPSKPAEQPAGDMDFNLDLGENEPAKEETGGMDFNLDMGETQSEPAQEEAGGMDFNLDMGESQPAAEEEKGGLDFSLDMGESAAEATPSGGEDSGSLDFDLDMGSEASSGPPTAEMSMNFSADDLTTEQAETDDTMSFDLGEGFDEGTATMPEPTMDDMALGGEEDLDIGGGDEVGTKLDLAKAYIDMGDPDGARSILDEVMAEGDASQKQEAQGLLDQIA